MKEAITCLQQTNEELTFNNLEPYFQYLFKWGFTEKRQDAYVGTCVDVWVCDTLRAQDREVDEEVDN